MVECLIIFRNNPRKVRIFSFYHNIIVGVANWFIQGLNEAEKTFSIKLLVSFGIRENNSFYFSNLNLCSFFLPHGFFLAFNVFGSWGINTYISILTFYMKLLKAICNLKNVHFELKDLGLV